MEFQSESRASDDRGAHDPGGSSSLNGMHASQVAEGLEWRSLAADGFQLSTLPEDSELAAQTIDRGHSFECGGAQYYAKQVGKDCSRERYLGAPPGQVAQQTAGLQYKWPGGGLQVGNSGVKHMGAGRPHSIDQMPGWLQTSGTGRHASPTTGDWQRYLQGSPEGSPKVANVQQSIFAARQPGPHKVVLGERLTGEAGSHSFDGSGRVDNSLWTGRSIWSLSQAPLAHTGPIATPELSLASAAPTLQLDSGNGSSMQPVPPLLHQSTDAGADGLSELSKGRSMSRVMSEPVGLPAVLAAGAPRHGYGTLQSSGPPPLIPETEATTPASMDMLFGAVDPLEGIRSSVELSVAGNAFGSRPERHSFDVHMLRPSRAASGSGMVSIARPPPPPPAQIAPNAQPKAALVGPSAPPPPPPKPAGQPQAVALPPPPLNAQPPPPPPRPSAVQPQASGHSSVPAPPPPPPPKLSARASAQPQLAPPPPPPAKAVPPHTPPPPPPPRNGVAAPAVLSVPPPPPRPPQLTNQMLGPPPPPPPPAANRNSEQIKTSSEVENGILDMRRSRNCQMLLSSLQMTTSEIVEAIMSLDESRLGEEAIAGLLNFVPTMAEEKALLETSSPDAEGETSAEHLFRAIVDILRYESKLQCLQYKWLFQTKSPRISHDIQVVTDTCRMLRSSSTQRRVMQACLSLGNTLNAETPRVGARGFSLDSLQRIIDTRSSAAQISLLDYLCKSLKQKYPTVMSDLGDEILQLEAGQQVPLKDLGEDVSALQMGQGVATQELLQCKDECEDSNSTDTFCSALEGFLTNSEEKVNKLSRDHGVMMSEAHATISFFGENPATCSYQRVCSSLTSFVRHLLDADQAAPAQKNPDEMNAQPADEQQVPTSAGTAVFPAPNINSDPSGAGAQAVK